MCRKSFISIAGVLIAVLAATGAAQSTDQSFPTPVHSSEISGVIKARDVGDARLTSHFYTFEGGQGDLFINVQATNFSGDVDVFVIPGLRPLTKMVMYADASGSETGRVIYFRKPEVVLLRIAGRTPGDEEATYRIKFAGSFIASRSQGEAPELPKVESEMEAGVRVNSVGTIIEVVPKATSDTNDKPIPVPDEEVSEAAKEGDKKEPAEAARKTDESASEKLPRKPEVVVSDPLAEEEKSAAKTEKSAGAPVRPNPETRRSARRTQRSRRERETRSDKQEETAQKDVPAPGKSSVLDKDERESRTSGSQRAKPVDPMAGIRLVIRFKNGGIIERPMTEVSKFTVEKAVLTVVSKDGAVGRYPMIEIAGVTIE